MRIDPVERRDGFETIISTGPGDSKATPQTEADSTQAGGINIATGIDISVEDIAELVLALLGKPASLREHVEERPGQVDRHIGSTEKIRRLCGWSARTSFEEGLARTVAWYRENEAWWRGIERSRTRESVSSS